MRILDISRPLEADSAVWPGDQPFRLTWSARRDQGSSVNLTALSGSPHVGTHADAPLHVEDGMPAIDEVDLAPYFGPVTVVSPTLGADRLVRESHVPARDRSDPPRILFRTDTDPDPRVFPRDFAALSPEAARRLGELEYVLVGIDTPSVDPADSKTLPAHHALLAGGLLWLENLDLTSVQPGRYEIAAFPLRIRGADASPVRAVLIDR